MHDDLGVRHCVIHQLLFVIPLLESGATNRAFARVQSDLPAGVLEDVLKVAFKLAAVVCKADIPSQAVREHFFQAIGRESRALFSYPNGSNQSEHK